MPVGLAAWANSAVGWLVFGCTMMVLAAIATTRDERAGRLQWGLTISHTEVARQLALLRDEIAGQARKPCGYKRDWKADHPSEIAEPFARARWMNPANPQQRIARNA